MKNKVLRPGLSGDSSPQEVYSTGEERINEKLLHFVCDYGNQEQTSSEDLRVLDDSYRISKSEM